MTTTIYTDGACTGNGTENARAGYGVYFGKDDPRNVAAPLEGELQTNNRAELQAILVALQLSLDELGFQPPDASLSSSSVSDTANDDALRCDLLQIQKLARSVCKRSAGHAHEAQLFSTTSHMHEAAKQLVALLAPAVSAAETAADEQSMLDELVKRSRPAHQIVVISDSSICVKGWNEWMRNWRKRGWRTAAGKDVANLDLWQRAAALKDYVEGLEGVVFTLLWTQGHKGTAGNEAADELARKGAGMHVVLF